MMTENTLKDFSLEALLDLMVLKLEEMKEQQKRKDKQLYKLKETEVKLIQKLIHRKKTIPRPSI